MQLRFAVGDKVRFVSDYYKEDGIENGSIGIVTYIDEHDDELPYNVHFVNPDHNFWCRADELISANSTPVISLSDLI